jgi:hypothetical protein
MGKSTRTSILLAMAAAALLLMTLLDDSIWGLLVGSWALMFWGMVRHQAPGSHR